VINKDRQVKEIIRCGKDPVHFINKYVKIQHPKKGLVPFNTYEFQDECVQDFLDHQFNVVLKARQMGLSTLTAAYAAWMVLFYKHKNVLIIATKLDVAKNIVKKVKTIIRNLPPWLVLPKMVRESVQTLEFSNGSQLHASPTSDSGGRGEALSLLIVDEAAFIPGFSELWKAILPTVSEGGKVIVISTPNGASGQYYDIYTGAESGRNQFNPIKITWDMHPDRDQSWIDNMARNLNKRQLAEEYLCDFASSGETFLSPDDISWLSELVREPISKGGPGMGLWTWEYPNPGEEYIISADISRGDSEDFSAFHVINATTDKVVAEFLGLIPPDGLGEFLVEMGIKYNQALICPENNSFGYSTIVKIRDLDYRRLYHPKHKNIYGFNYISDIDDQKFGFQTNVKTRMEALVKLESTIRNKKIEIYSSRFVNELKSFVWSGGKAEARKGKHDDLVMSLAIGLTLFEQGGHDPEKALKDQQMMLLGMSRANNSYENVKNNGNEVLANRPRYGTDQEKDLSKYRFADDKEVRKHFSWLFS